MIGEYGHCFTLNPVYGLPFKTLVNHIGNLKKNLSVNETLNKTTCDHDSTASHPSHPLLNSFPNDKF